MSFFEIATDSCLIGFQTHVNLDPVYPVELQIGGTLLTGYEDIDKQEIATIIQKNSSLRLSFGWSFESDVIFRDMMVECLAQINPKYELYMGNLITDLRCSWIGFVPFNSFEMEVCVLLSREELVEYNNLLVGFQTDVIRFIVNHKYFLQHSLLRNSDYRFQYFKVIRNQPLELSDAFSYYINAIIDTTGLTMISRIELEEQVGCHYLQHPDIFFELLEFYKLKGIIYE